MRVDFAFGKTGLTVDLPEGPAYRMLEARWADALGDQDAALEAALDAPIGCPPLREMARGKASAAISVCDITRPAPNREVLPPLLARLEAAGVPREGITILIATGLHRPATDAEFREICGEETAARYRVLNGSGRVLQWGSRSRFQHVVLEPLGQFNFQPRAGKGKVNSHGDIVTRCMPRVFPS